MEDPLGNQQVLTTLEPTSAESLQVLVDQFKTFINTFKDGDAYVYYSMLESPYERVSVELNIPDLPQGLQELFYAQPYRARELFIRAAQERAEKPVSCSFVHKRQHQALQVGQLAAQHLDRLVTVQGLLVGSGRTRPKTAQLVAVCRACQHRLSIDVPFGLGTVQLPGQCQRVRGDNEQRCPPGAYVVVPQQCRYVDSQILKIQDDQRNSIPVHLEGDLVDQDIIAGQFLNVTGVLTKFCLVGFGYQVFSKKEYLNNILSHNRISTNVAKEFAAAKPLERLRQMIAPHLHGLENIKLAISCQLVGGQSKITSEGTRLRGEINILLLADPGVGKSEMLKTAQLLSRIAVQTSGKSTSAVGLTAAVIKDSHTGEFILEGGALVLADGGILCIDEFDKCRPEDIVALHETMEQGTVSINKAGIQSILSTRVSILAAANPTFGRYDELIGLSEQIDLQATIASRFDLIFVLKDVIDMDRDRLVVEKIGKNLQQDSITNQNKQNGQQQSDTAFLRSYFEEAKRIKTQIGTEASQFLQDFWIKMRRQESNMIVTVRQLEALIRLSESIAKLHFRETVLLSDAEAAVKLYKSSTGDADGENISESIGKISSLQVSEAQRIIKERLNLRVPQNEVAIIKDLKQMGLSEGAILRAIQLLINNGQIQQLRGRMIVRIK